MKRGEWLPCPFCGRELVKFGRGIRNGKVVMLRIHPYTRGCVLGFGLVIERRRWNRRAKIKSLIVQQPQSRNAV